MYSWLDNFRYAAERFLRKFNHFQLVLVVPNLRPSKFFRDSWHSSIFASNPEQPVNRFLLYWSCKGLYGLLYFFSPPSIWSRCEFPWEFFPYYSSSSSLRFDGSRYFSGRRRIGDWGPLLLGDYFPEKIPKLASKYFRIILMIAIIDPIHPYYCSSTSLRPSPSRLRFSALSW